jgi:hypothetical protein
MSVTEKIEKLRQNQLDAPDAFKEQLDRARKSLERLDAQRPVVRGIDRSGEFVPVARPTIVRALVERD